MRRFGVWSRVGSAGWMQRALPLCFLGASACGAATGLRLPDGSDGPVAPRVEGPFTRYVVVPSSEPFVNACDVPGHATQLANIDDSTADVALPFPFWLYAVRAQRGWVSSNGVVGFGTPSGSFGNQCLPSTGAPQSAILAFWDDLFTRTRGVCTATTGAAPDRRFVVTWDDVQFCCGMMPDAHLTFSVLLEEGTQAIDVVYANLADTAGRATGTSATVGLNDATGRLFTQNSCETAALRSGLALRYVPQP